MRICLLGTPSGALPDHLARLDADEVVTAPADGPFDLVLAADWRACADVFRVDAARRALYVAAPWQRTLAPGDPDLVPATLALDLPLDYLVEARWVAEELSALRPEARVRVAPPGRAAVAGAPPNGDGPLRVLPAGGGAEAALAAMDEPHARVGAAAEADVVVSLSAGDGVLGAPLAGFAAGATAIVVDTPGHDELVRHRVNGLVAEPEDPQGAARWLDTLSRDRELLAALRAEALRTADAWPSHDDAAARFRAILTELVENEPPPDARWPVRLMDDAIAQAALLRERVELQHSALVRADAAAAEARAVVASAGVPLDGRAVRVARALHRLGGRVRRG